MSEPTSLPVPNNSGLVPMLTRLLHKAQRGEINQIALVFMEPDSNGYGVYISDRDGELAPGTHPTLALIGAVTDLQFTLLTAHNKEQD